MFRITVFIVSLMSLVGCKSAQSPDDPRTKTQRVSIAVVRPADANIMAFTGVVTARVQSNLGFRVAGKVTERLVDTGQTVKKGQALMRLDPTDYQHAVTTRNGNVEAAHAKLIQALADEARYQRLVDSGAVSKSAYDLAKADADSAKAVYDAATAQLKVAKDETEYALLEADADGIIVDTLVEPGQFISAGQIVVRLAHAGPREAAVNLPETLRPALGSIAQAKLFSSAADALYPARLRQLSDAADPLTRTFDARFVLGGTAANAPLGATVKVSITHSETADQVMVPIGAIDDEGQGPGIWLFDQSSSSVFYKSVHLIRVDGEAAVVEGDLKPGDKIIAVGGHFLHESQIVRISE